MKNSRALWGLVFWYEYHLHSSKNISTKKIVEIGKSRGLGLMNPPLAFHLVVLSVHTLVVRPHSLSDCLWSAFSAIDNPALSALALDNWQDCSLDVRAMLQKKQFLTITTSLQLQWSEWKFNVVVHPFLKQGRWHSVQFSPKHCVQSPTILVPPWAKSSFSFQDLFLSQIERERVFSFNHPPACLTNGRWFI